MQLTMIGPLPPPLHGQSVVMSYIVSAMTPHFPHMRVIDINPGASASQLPVRRAKLLHALKTMRALGSVRGSDTVYLAVKAEWGMWLTTLLAAAARLAGARLFLHHHSYLYVGRRRRRMAVLTRVAGPCAHHIVLSRGMAEDLHRVMPEIRELVVVSNAGLIDRGLADLPLSDDDDELVLGHLSNLSLEKGIAEVVDLAVELHRSGKSIRLIVGGPTADENSAQQLHRASNELGSNFDYRGPLTGDAKRSFFTEITHFVFPTHNDAVPLVLYEALAAGAVCVATRQGAIAEQLSGSPAVLADSSDSFVTQTLPVLLAAKATRTAAQQCRDTYAHALSQSEEQLAELIDHFSSIPERAR